MLHLRTPGFDAPPAPVDLAVDKIIAASVGAAPVDLPVGTVADVRWQMEQHANIGWGEVAILAGTPSLGNSLARWVGAVDVTPEWETYLTGVQGVASVTLAHPVAAHESLYVAFAQWCAPTVTATGHVIPSTTVVRLMGSAWTDPIASGSVGLIEGGWKPSLSLGQSASVDAFQNTRPVAAAVVLTLPPPPPPPPDPPESEE